MATPGYFEKQSRESWVFDIDFTGRLRSGVTLVSGTWEAINLSTGAVDNSVLASTTATINGYLALGMHQAGSNQTSYKLTLLATLSEIGRAHV